MRDGAVDEEDPEEAAAAKRQRMESQRQAGGSGKLGAAEQARGPPAKTACSAPDASS